jgi:hypothetical protein
MNNKLLLISRHWSMPTEGIKLPLSLNVGDRVSFSFAIDGEQRTVEELVEEGRELIVCRQDFKFAGVFKALRFYQGVFLATRN